MRFLWFAVTVLLFALPTRAVHAGGQPSDSPSIVIRVQSLDALLSNLNLVVKLVGQEEAAATIEGLVKAKIGRQGLQGVDPSRPFGAYVRFGKTIDDINGAILIPMADQKTFLKLLETLNIDGRPDKDGIYTHKTNKNVNVYFRFAKQYLYVTSVNTESIQEKKLPDPARALAVTGNATVSVVARVDQIPDDGKLIALAWLKEALAAQKQAQPNETKVQETFRVTLWDELNKFGSRVIREADEMRFDLNVDKNTRELTVNLSITGKPGTELKRTIETLGKHESPLAGLGTTDVAFRGAVNVTLPDALNKAFRAVIDEVGEKSVEGIQDKEKKKQAQALFDALSPTVKAGEFQFVAAVLGTQEKKYTFVGAAKLKDGDNLGNTTRTLLKEALKDIPKEQHEKLQLDFDTVGRVKIHKFEIPKNAKIDHLTEVTGDNWLYLAFRDDALFVAVGKDALATLKTAVARKESGVSQPLVVEFDVARMAPLMAETPEQKDRAAKFFADGQQGRVRLALEGGSSLSFRLQMRLNVLEYLVKMKNDKNP